MLRKIMIITILAILLVSFGCKKKESPPAAPEASPAPQAQTDANAPVQ